MRTKRTKAKKIAGFFASLFRFIAEKQKKLYSKNGAPLLSLRTMYTFNCGLFKKGLNT
jgi:hypothetical protein